MSRLILSLFLLLSVLSICACAVPPQTPQIDIESALAAHYPQIKYQEINPTPLSGIHEVVVENSEIIYFVPESGHMFFGELWTSDRQNLTRISKSKRMSSKVNEFPLDLAIVIGEGPHQVIEVTDPDCPFCRQSSDFFAGRDDITRYVFLFPLDRLHPHAEAKARYILCAEDQELAYEEVFSGKYDNQPVPAVKDNGLLSKHREIARKTGITGTPQFWINGQHISGFNPQQFEKLLK